MCPSDSKCFGDDITGTSYLYIGTFADLFKRGGSTK